MRASHALRTPARPRPGGAARTPPRRARRGPPGDRAPPEPSPLRGRRVPPGRRCDPRRPDGRLGCGTDRGAADPGRVRARARAADHAALTGGRRHPGTPGRIRGW
ncbi:hypothetical protein FV230_06065 [Methylobacterium sp. WL6]|nr:hypothetical protein FV230_06065 [Methylobacterium sp. WL6]